MLGRELDALLRRREREALLDAAPPAAAARAAQGAGATFPLGAGGLAYV